MIWLDGWMGERQDISYDEHVLCRNMNDLT